MEVGRSMSHGGGGRRWGAERSIDRQKRCARRVARSAQGGLQGGVSWAGGREGGKVGRWGRGQRATRSAQRAGVRVDVVEFCRTVREGCSSNRHAAAPHKSSLLQYLCSTNDVAHILTIATTFAVVTPRCWRGIRTFELNHFRFFARGLKIQHYLCVVCQRRSAGLRRELFYIILLRAIGIRVATVAAATPRLRIPRRMGLRLDLLLATMVERRRPARWSRLRARWSRLRAQWIGTGIRMLLK